MPGARVVCGRDAVLSRARLPWPRRRRGRDPPRLRAAAAAEMTWAQLRASTARIQAGLRALGVGRGDRVAAYMPNIPETVAAFLATASLGAVWSSCSPDFGARSVIDRFAQIEPTVLLAVDGYRYGGRDFDRAAVVEQIHAEVGGTLVRLGYLAGGGWQDGLRGSARRRARAAPRRLRRRRSGSSTRAARPGFRRRSCRVRAASCSSSSSTRTSTSTCTPATARSGSRRRAG